MKKIAFNLVVVLVVFFLVAISQPVDAQKYTVTDLGVFGAPGAINNNGTVVGGYWPDPTNYVMHAFSWKDGQFTDLGSFNGWSRAYAVNNTGLIVGVSNYPNPNINGRAFSWIDNVMTDLGSLGNDSVATGVNDAGFIVGHSRYTSSGNHYAVIWRPGEGITNIDTLGSLMSTAEVINNHNQVACMVWTAVSHTYFPYLWENGTWTELPTLTGGDGFSEIHAINDAGQVVGRAHGSGNHDHCVLWDNGAIIDLGQGCTANGINNSGVIVGGWDRAWMWADGRMIDLNTKIPSDSGIILDGAWAINDSGWIVATATTGHIYLLKPQPNQPPMAICQDVTVAAGPSCTATASIDNGSSDPDGDPITLVQSPAGPYALGATIVTLTVTDSEGASSNCSATVTVLPISGDLNKDCKVDAADLNILKASIGKCKGQVGYVAEANYDGDNCVTLNDYRLWYGYYQKYLKK